MQPLHLEHLRQRLPKYQLKAFQLRLLHRRLLHLEG
jgi:hypothetical protein